MDIEAIRSYCLSLPGTTEDIQWGDDLLFRIGNKMYAGIELNPASKYRLSFKCEPEAFAELIEKDGCKPSAYIGRYHWLSVQLNALGQQKLKELIAVSYRLVFDRLPGKLKLQVSQTRAKPKLKSQHRK